MTKITDMTRDEIVALSEQDLQRMMDYECAENGIALLPLPVKPVTENFDPDQKYYEIGDMCFVTLSDAERVMEALSGVQVFKDDYDSSVGYEHKFLAPETGRNEIVPRTCFSAELFDRIRVQLARQKELTEQYEKDIKLYQKAQHAREDTCAYILEAYNKANEEARYEQMIRGKFEQYLTLADGNRILAMHFLRKVETVPQELAEELAPETVPQSGI